jgi:hypothetical protein
MRTMRQDRGAAPLPAADQRHLRRAGRRLVKRLVGVSVAFEAVVEVEADSDEAAMYAAKRAADDETTLTAMAGWLAGESSLHQRAFAGTVVGRSGPYLRFAAGPAADEPSGSARATIRARLARAVAEDKAVKPAEPAPRYDDVFAEGVAALDRDGGADEPAPPADAEPNTLRGWSEIITDRRPWSERALAERPAAVDLPDAQASTALVPADAPSEPAEYEPPATDLDRPRPQPKRRRAATPTEVMSPEDALAEAKRRWGPGGQIMPNPSSKNPEMRYWVGDRACQGCNVGYGPGWYGRGATWEDAFRSAAMNGFSKG